MIATSPALRRRPVCLPYLNTSDPHVNHLTDSFIRRTMAHNLHRSQPQAQHVRLLPQQRIPWLLPPLLQNVARSQMRVLACESHPVWIRAAGEQISGYEGAEKWVQAAVYESWRCWGEEGERTVDWGERVMSI